VQVLTRDLERWIKDYRIYLNSADTFMAAFKAWMTFETSTSRYEAWDIFFAHIEKVSTKIFPVLENTIQLKCIQPLQVHIPFPFPLTCC
jgi:hypothetical protein